MMNWQNEDWYSDFSQDLYMGNLKEGVCNKGEEICWQWQKPTKQKQSVQ